MNCNFRILRSSIDCKLIGIETPVLENRFKFNKETPYSLLENFVSKKELVFNKSAETLIVIKELFKIDKKFNYMSGFVAGEILFQEYLQELKLDFKKISIVPSMFNYKGNLTPSFFHYVLLKYYLKKVKFIYTIGDESKNQYLPSYYSSAHNLIGNIFKFKFLERDIYLIPLPSPNFIIKKEEIITKVFKHLEILKEKDVYLF